MNIESLPPYISYQIFAELSFRERAQVASTCTIFSQMAMNVDVLCMQYNIPKDLAAKFTVENIRFFEETIIPNLCRYVISSRTQQMNPFRETHQRFRIDTQTQRMQFTRFLDSEMTNTERLFLVQFGVGNHYFTRRVVYPITIIDQDHGKSFRETLPLNSITYLVLHVFELTFNQTLKENLETDLEPRETRQKLLLKKIFLLPQDVVSRAMLVYGSALYQFEDKPKIARTSSDISELKRHLNDPGPPPKKIKRPITRSQSQLFRKRKKATQ